MDGFQRELLRRVPLAEAVLLLWQYAFDQAFCQELYQEHRGASYQRQLEFPTLLGLVRDALLQHGGSGRQSFQRAREAQVLSISDSSTYGKLGRIPIHLSLALLRQGSARLSEVAAGRPATILPASLKGLAVLAIDGKTIKHVTRRLKPLRPRRGKLTGGKLVVALSLRTGLAVAMNAVPDGDANDVPLLPGLLQQIETRAQAPRLWVLDAQYCDLNLPQRLTRLGGHYLIRYSVNVSFTPDANRPGRRRRHPRGGWIVDEWGWLGAGASHRRRYVRRITLRRSGQEDVAVISDLLEARRYPAADLLAVYLERWGIERMFQQVTEVFALQHLIGSTPQATVFQGAFCLLIYNLIQVVRGYVAQDGVQAVAAVSTEQLFYDVRRQLTTWTVAGDLALTLALLLASRPATAAALRQRLRQLIDGAWTDRWLKAPCTRHRVTKQTIPMPACGRTSVWKILQEAQDARRPETKRC